MDDTKTSTERRDAFSGRIGFILAAAGAAVGLGNIWRFPYLAAEHGGGIFLLVYTVLALTFGFALMVAEIAIGRKTGLSAIGAYGSLDKRFSFLGYLASVAPVLIFPYYCVIGGWVMKYALSYVSAQGGVLSADGYFWSYVSGLWEPIFWFLLFLIITAVLVFFGVKKGIETLSKLMMPLLVVLVLFITVYIIVASDGALEGVRYYLTPDFSKFSIMTVVAATGQLFYSMSLAMGTMITFGSYMKKSINIERAVHSIELFDLGIAFLSGLMVIAGVFAFSGGDESALSEGPGLMFVTLPRVFSSIPSGALIGGAFFVMVLLAAITSSVSLMETVVSVLIDKTHLSRGACCVLALIIALILGLPSALGYSIWSDIRILGLGILDLFDFTANNLLMPVVAIISCIFIGYIIKPKAVFDEVRLSGSFKGTRRFSVLIRYIAPVCLSAILVSSVLDLFGIITV